MSNEVYSNEVIKREFERYGREVRGWRDGMYARHHSANEYTHDDVEESYRAFSAGWLGALRLRASLAAESSPIWEKLAEIGKDMPDLAAESESLTPLIADLDPEIHQEQECKCVGGWGVGSPEEICGAFVKGSMRSDWCETCGHDKACHGEQA